MQNLQLWWSLTILRTIIPAVLYYLVALQDHRVCESGAKTTLLTHKVRIQYTLCCGRAREMGRNKLQRIGPKHKLLTAGQLCQQIWMKMQYKDLDSSKHNFVFTNQYLEQISPKPKTSAILFFQCIWQYTSLFQYVCVDCSNPKNTMARTNYQRLLYYKCCCCHSVTSHSATFLNHNHRWVNILSNHSIVSTSSENPFLQRAHKRTLFSCIMLHQWAICTWKCWTAKFNILIF